MLELWGRDPFLLMWSLRMAIWMILQLLSVMTSLLSELVDTKCKFTKTSAGACYWWCGPKFWLHQMPIHKHITGGGGGHIT
jgi:hypothetical protein